MRTREPATEKEELYNQGAVHYSVRLNSFFFFALDEKKTVCCC